MQDGQTLSTAPLITGQEAARLYPLGAQLAERVIVLPGERIHMSGVEIPIRDARKRMSALPFAMEPELAQPLSDLYFAIGPRLSTNRYVAAAIDRSVIKSWIERAGDGDTILTPEMALLPVPSPASCRTCGSGIATSYGHLTAAALLRPMLSSMCFGTGCPGRFSCASESRRTVWMQCRRSPTLRSPGFQMPHRYLTYGRKALGRTGDRTQLKVAAALIVSVMAAHTLLAGATPSRSDRWSASANRISPPNFASAFSLGADTRPGCDRSDGRGVRRGRRAVSATPLGRISSDPCDRLDQRQ